MQLSDMFLTIQEDLKHVEVVLDHSLHSKLPLVPEVSRYVINNGGKRLRPALFLLCARVAGVASHRDLAKIGASLEMIHTASLLHDDVVDDALLRRGKPSTKAKWGNQVSVLVGDFLWCRGCGILVECDDIKLLDVVTKAIVAVTEGVLLELSRQNDMNIDQEAYFEMIRGKTAALFGACGECAGIVAGLSEQYVTALKRYCFDLGMAFQLADDALDYISQDKGFGKKVGGDLREGRLTYPLILALKQADESELQTIREALISDHLGDAQFQNVLSIIQRYDGVEETFKLARDFAEKAKAHLKLFKPSIEREALIKATDYAVERRI